MEGSRIKQCEGRGVARAGPSRAVRRRAQVACTSPEVLEIVRMRLRVVCDPTRVQIMAMLDRDGPASTQELADRLEANYQNIAKHLRVLHEAGMIARIRSGNRVRYELADWSALWLVEQVAATISDHLEAQRQRIAPDPG